MLTTEQQFLLRRAELEAENMNRDQLLEAYLICSKQLLQQQSATIALMKDRLGFPESPQHSSIPDEKVELELLRSHYKAATMVLDSLQDEQMIRRLAVALQGAYLVMDVRQPDHGDAVVMVRAMLKVLLGDFPATNCRNIEHQLEGNL